MQTPPSTPRLMLIGRIPPKSSREPRQWMTLRVMRVVRVQPMKIYRTTIRPTIATTRPAAALLRQA